MSMNCNFYTFNKRINSTKQPDAADAVQTLIELKAPTNILHPDIMLTGIPNPYVFNYAYIQTFSRYYFIRNWTWEAGRWIASLDVDVLASYKSSIAGSSQYVSRSSYASDSNIVDDVYPVKTEFTTQRVAFTATRNMTFYYSQGCFIIGVISKGGTGTFGCVTYYALTFSEFNTFKNALFNDISWASVSDISTDLLKTLVNPFDYIVSCKWCPCTDYTGYFDTAVTSIPLGYWSFTCSARRISDAVLSLIQHSFTISTVGFPLHPLSNTRGAYVNMSKQFSEYTMLLAPYGVIPLPNEWIMAGISCIEDIDIITGEATLTIYGGNNSVPLKVVHTDMFVDIQLAQVRSSGGLQGLGLATGLSAAGSIADAVLENGILKNAATGIISAVHDSVSEVSTMGNNGNFSRFCQFGGFNPVVCAIYYDIADRSVSHLGTPLCMEIDLEDIPGYIQCVSPDVGSIGTNGETAEINRFLSNGFFLE